MPDLLAGMQKGDKTCLEVHDALIRYNQVFMSIVQSRRAIDNPQGRWGEIQDTLYSSGAWADANLGHRSRTMLALPIIWADYNRGTATSIKTSHSRTSVSHRVGAHAE